MMKANSATLVQSILEAMRRLQNAGVEAQESTLVRDKLEVVDLELWELLDALEEES